MNTSRARVTAAAAAVTALPLVSRRMAAGTRSMGEEGRGEGFNFLGGEKRMRRPFVVGIGDVEALGMCMSA